MYPIGVCNVNGVKGYPTLKYYSGGLFSEDYSGPRSETDFIKFINEKSAQGSKEPPPPPVSKQEAKTEL